MPRSLPDSPAGFTGSGWDDLRPYYQELEEDPLGAGQVEPWLERWNRLEELVGEAQTMASLAYFNDTGDPTLERAHLRWVSEVEPRRDEAVNSLSVRLLRSGFTRPDLEQVLARFANRADLFRSESIELEGEVQTLKVGYQRLTAGLQVDWDGRTRTVQELGVYAQATDRSVRERAFRTAAEAYMANHDQMAEIFDQMVLRRTQIAANAGFANYRDFAHRQKNRFDYTPQDCLDWDEAVAGVVVPAVARLRERRRRDLGVDSLRPWDLACDPNGLQPLQPYREPAELADRASAVFTRVSPAFGDRFETMRREGLLDLMNRAGKRPGAFCTGLEFRRRPYVFGNAVGTPGDVSMLLHEMGHAFHAFEAFEALPLTFQRFYGAEIAEVASMSMELLSAPYLERSEGGYYAPEEARRERLGHLESTLSLIPHIASVDAFQQWVYTEGVEADQGTRDSAWLRIRARYDPGVNWEGLEPARIARWYQQQHIFSNPFYYIEYGLAQFGALQVWRNARQDQAGAIEAYRRALALGGTRPLPELFATAGAQLIFDPGDMAALVGLVEDEIESLRRA